MKALVQFIKEHQSIPSRIKLDMEWIDNDKPVHTKSGIDVKIDSVDMKEVPNQLHGTAYYSSGPIEGWVWDETGKCLQCKDEKGNPFRPGDEETLIKKMLEFKVEYSKLSDVVKEQELKQELIYNHPYFAEAYLEEEEFRRDLKWNHEVLEKYGAYEGQVELVNELVDCIVHYLEFGKELKRITLSSDNLEKFAKKRKIKMTIFFDKLEIILNRSSNSYMPDMSTYDEKRNKFDKVVIYVDQNEFTSIPNISSIFTHELTHAYEDFKRNEKHLDWTLKDLGKDPVYQEAKRMLSRPMDEVEKFVGRILYSMNKSETNAFYSEFTTLLDSLYEKDTVVEYSDALDQFKKTQPYQNLIEIISVLDNSKPIIQDFITSYWNDTTGSKFSTNKCMKKLKFLSNKRFQKMTEVLPKIYFDWLSKKRLDESMKKGYLENIRPGGFIYKKDNFFRENIEKQLL